MQLPRLEENRPGVRNTPVETAPFAMPGLSAKTYMFRKAEHDTRGIVSLTHSRPEENPGEARMARGKKPPLQLPWSGPALQRTSDAVVGN